MLLPGVIHIYMRNTQTDRQPIITDQYSMISDRLVVSKEADQRDRSDAAKLNGLIYDLACLSLSSGFSFLKFKVFVHFYSLVLLRIPESETLWKLFQFLSPGLMPNWCCSESQQCCVAIARQGVSHNQRNRTHCASSSWLSGSLCSSYK